MTVTIVDYLKAIKQQIHVAKATDSTGLLHKPSPAQLRNYCLYLLDNGMNETDQMNVRYFLQVSKSVDLRKALLQMDVDRLKAVQKFIEGSIENPSSTNLELVAILLNFKPRPYVVFSKQGAVISSEQTVEIDKPLFPVFEPQANTIKKRIVMGLLVLVGIFCLGFTIKSIAFPEQDCVQWQENHYERVDCSTNSTAFQTPVLPASDDLMRLKRIEVTKATSFFVAGKAVVWYSKVNGKPEFFTTHGFHPVTGKPLKPITNYMIHKYVDPK